MDHPADLSAPQPSALAPQQAGRPTGPSVFLSAEAVLPAGEARQAGLAGSAMAATTKSFKSPAVTQWPWRAGGFLPYAQASGDTFRCTAAVIVHDNKSTLWTAAHCLHAGKTGNGYHKNAVFVPGFDGANTPYGI
ncbi:hypothetical protein ACFV30_40115 [Streptomyces sp. NPDC059752]|uniref:hypothetical protein n=1 Tax=unclassified Streptomyces TaxID=2593676 RepID=UPI0036620C91